MFLFSKISKPETFTDFSEPRAFKIWMRWAIGLACLIGVSGLVVCACLEGRSRTAVSGGEAAQQESSAVEAEGMGGLDKPVRPAPARFPPDTNLPQGKESLTVGAIDLEQFDAARELIRFEDPRVTIVPDSEGSPAAKGACLIHRSVAVPLQRLVNLVAGQGGRLKVLGAYRPVPPGERKSATSLHSEGRAVALTGEQLALEELAKLAWQAGFDFVLYEAPRQDVHQVHASVKRIPAPPPKAE